MTPELDEQGARGGGGERELNSRPVHFLEDERRAGLGRSRGDLHRATRAHTPASRP